MLRKMAANPNNKPTVLCGLQYIIGTHDLLIGEHYSCVGVYICPAK